MPHITVELPGLTLTNELGQDGPFLRDLRNWHDGTETRRNSEQRETGFGLYRDDDPEEAGRYPIVYGRLLTRRVGDEWPVRAAVMALKNLPTFEIAVTDPTGRWRAEVALSGKPAFDLHDDGWADFEIPLEAADPRKYGPLIIQTVGLPTPGVGMSDPFTDPIDEGDPGNLGRIVCTNTGGAPTSPKVTIYGGVSEGFELLCMEHARVVRVTRPIPDGSHVTVDMGSGEVWIDDQSILPASYVPVSEWFEIGAGETCTIQWTPLGITTGAPRMETEHAGAIW